MLIDTPPTLPVEAGEVSEVLVGALPARCLVAEVTVNSQFDLRVEWSDREDRKRVIYEKKVGGYSNLEHAKFEIPLLRFLGLFKMMTS